ncbi:hypothetical protein JW905_00615 [bacterium]|nr:hypothetical protein [candidate division CSSED10-310 bacterium]
MKIDDYMELSDEEQAAYRALSGVHCEAALHEDDVMAALRRRRLLRKPRYRLPLFARTAMATAVIIVTFILGVQYGRNTNPPTSSRQAVATGTPGHATQFHRASEDLLATANYRLEPDRPGNGMILFTKMLGQ